MMSNLGAAAAAGRCCTRYVAVCCDCCAPKNIIIISMHHKRYNAFTVLRQRRHRSSRSPPQQRCILLLLLPIAHPFFSRSITAVTPGLQVHMYSECSNFSTHSPQSLMFSSHSPQSLFSLFRYYCSHESLHASSSSSSPLRGFPAPNCRSRPLTL
jgi:hypothetical protein